MRTTARRDGASYRLSGRKLYITNGWIADLVLVYAKTSPEAGARGISAFVVEKGFPGFSVAQKLEKMGMRGSPTAELVFDECRVPAENRIGEEDAGVAIVMSGLDLERAVAAPMSVGLAERCLELALDHARERRQFGRPIGEFQMIQAKLADMYTQVEAARLLSYKALAAVNELAVGAGGRGAVHRLTAASFLLAAETATRVASDALQIHGGSGYIWEMEVNRLYRAAKLMEIGAGTSEVRRLIIAEELLRGGLEG
jgi:isovaleryl-CoA dehydrogenase